MNSLTKDFWEDKHNRTDGQWLTGTGIQRLLGFYAVDYKSLSDKIVLEIGVGTTSCTRELSKLSKELYCSDISQIALDNVKQFAKATCLSTELKTLPAVDVAFCHLVLVHCTDQEALRILNDVNLTDSGILYVQFSGLKEKIDARIQHDLIDNGSHFLDRKNR